MSELVRSRAPDLANRRLWGALALSVLVHLAFVWKIPSVTLSRPADEKHPGPLIVELTPPPRPPERPREPAPTQPREPAQPRAQAPTRPPAKARERKPPAPPVIARREPGGTRAPAPPDIPIQAPTPAPPRPSGDLSDYVEARRRARGETPPRPAPAQESVASAPAEDENARANRIAAANLGLDRKPTFGPDRKGGGVFQITRMGYDSAEFIFYGWNKDIGRNTSQLIEVRKGGHSDMRTAVVRRMIGIIRDHEQGDFVWESHRLNRNVTLSARLRDDAGLQAFLMREFFEDARRPAVAR